MDYSGGSPMQSPVHTQTLPLALNVPTSGLLLAIMDTVGDLSTAWAQTNVQQARTTQQMQARSDFVAIRPHDGGGASSFMVNLRDLLGGGKCVCVPWS